MIDWQQIRSRLAEQDARDLDAVYHLGWSNGIRWAASLDAAALKEYVESLDVPAADNGGPRWQSPPVV